MGTFKQEIEAIIKSILPTDVASNKIDKRLITAPWDIIVGSGPAQAVKKTLLEVWAYITGQFVGAYKKQQYAVPVTLAGQTGTVTLDANTHQDVVIGVDGGITFAAPSNAGYGKMLFVTISGVAAQTLTWDAVFRANADVALPTQSVANKFMYLNFRCYDGTRWVLLGMVTGA